MAKSVVPLNVPKESVEEFLKRGGEVRKVKPGASYYDENGPINQSKKQQEKWKAQKATKETPNDTDPN